MPALRFAVLAAFGLSLAACSTDPRSREGGGTAAGTMAGGAIGNGAGGNAGNRVTGTASGASVSTFIGSRIGAALDDDDKRRAYAAQIQALESGPSGAPVAWRNPDSGRYGNVVPGPAYQTNGGSCRQYTHTVYIDAKPQIERGTACRKADGTWSTAS